MQPRAQSIAARKKRAVVDSDDEEEEVQHTVKPKPEPEDDDAMEEDFPVDGDRQDRYQQSRLRDEARFAAAQRSERVVSDKSDDMDMDDFLERPTGEPDFDDAASDTSSSADEIVEELDVYINQNLANKLFLFQYPLRSKDFSEDLTPRSGRIKPGAKMVEVNVPLDTGSHTYDRFKGEELAETAGEGGGQSAAHILGRSKGKTKLLDTQIYNSTPVPTSATYFAGVVDGLGLHLTPIRSVVQLRPNLAYLNKSKEKPKTGPGSDQPGPVGDDGSAQPARVLQVGCSRRLQLLFLAVLTNSSSTFPGLGPQKRPERKQGRKRAPPNGTRPAPQSRRRILDLAHHPPSHIPRIRFRQEPAHSPRHGSRGCGNGWKFRDLFGRGGAEGRAVDKGSQGGAADTEGVDVGGDSDVPVAGTAQVHDDQWLVVALVIWWNR
jgi:hypothetical protein